MDSSNNKPRRHEAVVNAIAGSAQATLTVLVGHPFDAVKARLQTGGEFGSTSWQCVKNTVRDEGVLALYRGSAMPWLSHMLKRPVQFTVSEYLRKTGIVASFIAEASGLHKDTSETVANFVIGGITGPIGAIAGTPLQVVKVGMQTTVRDTHRNSFAFAQHHFRSHGIRGFYRGFVATAAKDCMFGASFIGWYYTFRGLCGEDRAWYTNFTTGAAANCLTWALLIPVDFVKTTIQRSATPLSISHVVRTTLSESGPTAFWRGMVPACLRTIPVAGVGMSAYEYVRTHLGGDW